MERATDMRRWQDWASFALGLWLAVSPWLADYAAHDVATANAAVWPNERPTRVSDQRDRRVDPTSRSTRRRTSKQAIDCRIFFRR